MLSAMENNVTEQVTLINATHHVVRNVGAAVLLKKDQTEMDEKAPYRLAFVLFVISLLVGCYYVFHVRKRENGRTRTRRYDTLESNELTSEFLRDTSDSDDFDEILLHK
jgi:hypothetical protein